MGKFKLSPGIKQTLTYTIGLVIMKCVSFVMLPYITKHLNPDSYGLLQIIIIVADFSGIILGAGLSFAMFRFAGTEKDPETAKHICANAMGLTLLISFALGIVLLYFSNNLQSLIPGNPTRTQVYFLIANITLGNIVATALSWLRLTNRAKHFLFATISRAIIQATLIFILLKHGYGLTGMLMSATISIVLMLAFILSLQLRETGVSYDRQCIKKLLLYGGPLIFSGIASFVALNLDKWWIAEALGTAAMAKYALAAKFAGITTMLLEPYLMWWGPRRFVLLKEDDGIAAIARISSMGLALCLIISLAVGLSSITAIQLLTPPNYHDATLYVIWLSIALVIKAAGDMLGFGCYVSKSTNIPTLINLLTTAFMIVLYYFLIPRYEIYGIFISLYGTYMLRLVLLLYFAQKTMRFPYPLKQLILISILTLVAFKFGSMPQSLWQQFLVTCFLVITLSFIGIKMALLPRLNHILQRKLL